MSDSLRYARSCGFSMNDDSKRDQRCWGAQSAGNTAQTESKENCCQPPQPQAGLSEEVKVHLPIGLTVFPTEDSAEYGKLAAMYIAELAPDGLQEMHEVLRIARLSWRLQNLRIFRHAKTARKEYAPLIRNTLEQTRYARVQFECQFLLGLMDAEPRNKLDTDKATDAMRETLKTIEDPAMQQALNKVLEQFDQDPSLDEIDVAEILLTGLLPPEAQKEKEKEKENGSNIELAYFSDVFTVENYRAELALSEEIERALDRALARYWKLKKEKAKSKTQVKRSRLLPPY